ncbi:hypothetical protein [Stenotrophomonas maltophilia]|uniref:hypothetical protein n=1 Tax=Stenotrophomonas maltophilia TaxID=40324 RepID=UPI001FA6C478|nr:hypothetical protein [Stenotrophomonas maltophilia]
MSAPVDVLAVLDSARKRLGDSIAVHEVWTSDQITQDDDLLEASDAFKELVKQNAALIEMCDELLRVNNRTLGRGAVRIQAAIISRFVKKLESTRVALARVKGGAA